MGDRSSDIGMLFSGGQNRLVVTSSANEVTGVGTVRAVEPSASASPGS